MTGSKNALASAKEKKGKHSKRKDDDNSNRGHQHDNNEPKKSKKQGLFPANGMYSAFGIVALGVVLWFVYQGYLETRVNTPLSEEKVVLLPKHDYPEHYWGSYRPGVYFGMKTREPGSLLAGLMWFMPELATPQNLMLRHQCNQDDNLDQYGWKEHDGKTFGVQVIKDKFIQLETSFLTSPGGDHGGEWSARIQVMPRFSELEGKQVALFFYLTLDDHGKAVLEPIKMLDSINVSELKETSESAKYLGLSAMHGHTDKLGDFRVSFHHTGSVVHSAYLSTKLGSPHLVKEAVQSGLRLMEDKKTKFRHISLAGQLFAREDPEKRPNLVVHQVTGKLPFMLEVVYESSSFKTRGDMLRGEVYDALLQEHRRNFQLEFEKKFHLNAKGFTQQEQEFAKAALSNLIGGIGYFYGSSRVQSIHNQEPVPYWNAPLYSAVPSRSFFPRGFLWDEGFHNLVISQWDRGITLDIMGHWFDLMNVEGWIPREQILGSEARARVPEQFIVQRNNQGNPPVFFLVLDSMFSSRNIRDLDLQELEFLNRMWPRLAKWYNWFNTTLHGTTPGSYYWRGREVAPIRELNAKSLSSGLDDYPRASHPTTEERHLDLRCWLAISAKVMASIADLIGKDGRKYEDAYNFLADNQLLIQQHWSPSAKRFADYGLHTSKVMLKQTNKRRDEPEPDMVRVVLEEPAMRFVDDTFGYVSLFPLITQILKHDAPELDQLLIDMRNPNLLWTKYGLRSLAKNSPLYNKYNTKDDAPYWRGPIWININYLVVRALRHYSQIEGPYRSRAEVLYNELRENLISNVLREYRRTGYIWEQYDDVTGNGKGCRPFTGWSTLVVLLMSETYA